MLFGRRKNRGRDTRTTVLRHTGGETVSPYRDLPPRSYWRTGVAERPAGAFPDFYVPRFPIDREMRIMTAGSCFAQHVGRSLSRAQFTVIDEEPLPATMPDTLATGLGFRQYSARYGNLYTVRQLLQLFDEAFGKCEPALPVWERDGLYFDAQRPNIDGTGLADPELVLRHRQSHLAAVKRAFRKAELFVFTLGLTEAWVHLESGTVYPTAPGTVVGSHDPAIFDFRNFNVNEVVADFTAFRERLKAINPRVRFLLTVSPVPLTATATALHVESATAYSKSVLRAACGMLVEQFDDIDYFPSFEIITSQTARGDFYRENLREVSEAGVQTAMETFLSAHGIDIESLRETAPENDDPEAAIACEDALLEGFAQ